MAKHFTLSVKPLPAKSLYRHYSKIMGENRNPIIEKHEQGYVASGMFHPSKVDIALSIMSSKNPVLNSIEVVFIIKTMKELTAEYLTKLTHQFAPCHVVYDYDGDTGKVNKSALAISYCVDCIPNKKHAIYHLERAFSIMFGKDNGEFVKLLNSIYPN